ncbi:Gypsy retrotransposon integrase-like protein 1 [Marasmius sp. AFHP31]|nr:Gypsy retrotransposon integrase-like protein 1 [Marasmius sp. AFHP31]
MEDDSNPYKKRRLQNACDKCRTRKETRSTERARSSLPSKIRERTGTEAFFFSSNRTPRGQKTVQSLVKAILSTTKVFIIPEDPAMIRQILIDLASRIVELEEKEKEQGRESLLTTSRASSPAGNPTTTTKTTGTTTPSIMSMYYTPASSPARIEQGSDGTNNGNKGTVSSTGEIELVESFMRQLRIDNQQDRHLGASSGANFLISVCGKRIEEATGNEVPGGPIIRKPMKVRRRDVFWKIYPYQRQVSPGCPLLPLPSDYTFPEPLLLSSLVSLYFDHVNPYLPILHRGIFEKSVREGLQHRDIHFAGVLLAVCATGARYSDDPRVLEDYDNEGIGKSRLTAGWKWFRQVRLIRSSFQTPPTLYELQLYCIIPFFLQGSTTPEAYWIVLGVAFRFAQELGIHRRKPETITNPTVESQLWNRAFWGLVAIDVVMSTSLGRPRAMSTDDFDVPLPIECDEEYWPIDGVAVVGAQEAFKQPPSKPSAMSYWVSLLRLFDIVGFAQRTIYAVRKTDMWTRMGMTQAEWNAKVMKELDELLANWVDGVPEHLKWNPTNQNPLFFTQSTIIWITYYWLQMLIHKPFMSFSTSAGSAEKESENPSGLAATFPSLGICVNAARAVVHILEAWQRWSERKRREDANGKGWVPEPGPGPFPTVLNAITSSAVVLFSNAWRGIRTKTTPDSFRELADVYRCMEVLSKWEDVIQVAGRFCDIVNELLHMCNLPPSLKGIKRLERADREGDHLPGRVDRKADRPIAGSRRAAAQAGMGAVGPTAANENETGHAGEGDYGGGGYVSGTNASMDLGASGFDLNLQAQTDANSHAHLAHTFSDPQAVYSVAPDPGMGDVYPPSNDPSTYSHSHESQGYQSGCPSPDFTLPISSTELGSLPLHETFNIYPDSYNYGYNEMDVDQNMGLFTDHSVGVGGAYDVLFGAGRHNGDGPEVLFPSLADGEQPQAEPQPQLDFALQPPVTVAHNHLQVPLPHIQVQPPPLQVQSPPLPLPLPQTQPSLHGQDAYARPSSNPSPAAPLTYTDQHSTAEFQKPRHGFRCVLRCLSQLSVTILTRADGLSDQLPGETGTSLDNRSI